MSDVITISNRAMTAEQSPEFAGVTKLVCIVDDETTISVGDDTGYTIEFENPIMTRTILTAMLNKIRGYQYQPYSADGALLDPSAEMGDAISVNGIYGGLFNRSRQFGTLMSADIGAPTDEEIDHEYKYETQYERKVRRELGNQLAAIRINASAIESEVSTRTEEGDQLRTLISQTDSEIRADVVAKEGGNNASFGWSLKATEFGLYAGNNKVFYVNSSGAYVQGEITATSGMIGRFNIGTKAIWNNISEYNGNQTTGVYIGTDGIQLGQNFKVNQYGNISAKNLSLTGGSININDKFSVTTQGVVTATDLRINGGSINLGDGVFVVNSRGAVTATNLTIRGGSININDNFKVNTQGDLTANSGTFKGRVYAGSIQYGGNYGTMSANGLTDYTINSNKYVDGSVGTSAIGGGAITEPKLGNYSVTNSKIGSAAVSYGKTSFTGTLDQVGINQADIAALSADVATIRSGYFNSISTNSIAFQNYYLYVYDGYVRAGGIW